MEPSYLHQMCVPQTYGQATPYATYPAVTPPPPQLGDLNQNIYLPNDPMPATNLPMYNIPQVPLTASQFFNDYDLTATSSTGWQMWNEVIPTSGIIQ